MSEIQPREKANIVKELITPENRIVLARIATEVETSKKERYLRDEKDSLQPVDFVNSHRKILNTNLDPNNPGFDPYEWTKAVVGAAIQRGVQLRRASVLWKNLIVSASELNQKAQENVLSTLVPHRIYRYLNSSKKPIHPILRELQGLIRSGEILLVLGRTGHGCSTFLKTIAGELNGLQIKEGSVLKYNGISSADMIKHYRGEIVYNAEHDIHFPNLTVRETLEFATILRTARNRVIASSRYENAQQVTEIVMAIFRLMHIQHTKVGNDCIRGVSGGERKRVSIAEMMLGLPSICCWDNSTRGLDAATALDFAQSLKLTSDLLDMTHALAIYQASQAIFDMFDKVLLLYNGRQIYFGPTGAARAYFENMGWYCPERQTTPEFLTGVTDPATRKARSGYAELVPRTSEEFEKKWYKSSEYQALLDSIRSYESELKQSNDAEDFRSARRAAQSRFMIPKNPYTANGAVQLRVCLQRSWERLYHDKVPTLTTLVGQICMALIVGSVFYGTPSTTNGLFAMGSVIFFALLLSALIAIPEISSLYSQKEIIDKQASFALYRPSIDAFANVILDLPIKLGINTCFVIPVYFLSGLKVEASSFFIFFLFTFFTRATMVVLFRTIGAMTKSISQALTGVGIVVLAMVIFAGYIIPQPIMPSWFGWIYWINPLAYAFEALMLNQMVGAQYPCEQFVPSYSNSGDSFVCSVPGAVQGQTTVLGENYLQSSFNYDASNLWRNFGILVSFWIFFLTTYLTASDLNWSVPKPVDVVTFRRAHMPLDDFKSDDPENDPVIRLQSATTPGVLSVPCNAHGTQIDPNKFINGNDSVQTFHWNDITYTIGDDDKQRTLLHNVSGYAKSGTLTALMGVSGAGKTTLLDALSKRLATGQVHGELKLNGKPVNRDFERRIGYVLQQDIHLPTATVREALQFSACLRQDRSIHIREKYEYVEEIIKMLGLEEIAEAFIGDLGQGLNGEQRRRVSIGVEVAARPETLIFLDEPTSGLDSQGSSAVVDVLRNLANNGFAVVATIHQPSATLFQHFDRLLFLGNGGHTIYFGEIGVDAGFVLEYLEKCGCSPCDASQNPAEYLLNAVGSTGKGETGPDLAAIWEEKTKNSAVCTEIVRESVLAEPVVDETRNFATAQYTQLYYVTKRVFQYHWRSPLYVWSKIALIVFSSLFIGGSFYKPQNSLQGFQSQVFSIFMLLSILSSLAQQIMPRFLVNRSLYEVRERFSRTYSAPVFISANLIAELTYQAFFGILAYASYYYLVFGIQSAECQGIILLFCIVYFIFATTFAYLVATALPDSQTAGAVITLLFSLTMIFNGAFQPPQALPGFWIFMYRVSPLTYILSGIAGVALHGRPVTCSATELSVFDPPIGQSCGQYLQFYLLQAGGQLYNPTAFQGCEYCPLSTSDQFLAAVGISWSQRWQNFGVVWAYVAFNIVATFVLYWLRLRR